MQKTRTIWNRCLESIREKVSKQSYQTWFEPIKPQHYEENTLTIQVPNPFFREWLAGNFGDVIKEVIAKEIGPYTIINYQYSPLPTSSYTHRKALRRPRKTTTNHQCETTPLNPKLTFHSFVPGPCNQLVYDAANIIVQDPGNNAFNILYIHGDIGLGKTHIAQAIAHEVKKKHPAKRIAYITAQNFTTTFIRSVREKKIAPFKNNFKSLDFIIIDDLHFLKGKHKTQEAFCHIFNHLQQRNKQIVFTSNCPPISLEEVEGGLLSRFKWGATLPLTKPSLETRINIIKKKLQEKETILPEEDITHIATRVTTNIRELEGVVLSIIVRSRLQRGRITRAQIDEIIDNIVAPVNQQQTKITIPTIRKIVANYYNLPIETIQSKSRQRSIVVPRKIVMYLAKKHTASTLATIGRALGKKDHSTVSHAIATITAAIASDPHIASQVAEIESALRNHATP